MPTVYPFKPYGNPFVPHLDSYIQLNNVETILDAEIYDTDNLEKMLDEVRNAHDFWETKKAILEGRILKLINNKKPERLDFYMENPHTYGRK